MISQTLILADLLQGTHYRVTDSQRLQDKREFKDHPLYFFSREKMEIPKDEVTFPRSSLFKNVNSRYFGE